MWNTKDRKKSWASEEKTTYLLWRLRTTSELFRKTQASETFKMAERKKTYQPRILNPAVSLQVRGEARKNPTDLEFWIQQNHPLRVGGNKDLLTQNLRAFVTTAPNLQEKLQDLQEKEN